MNNKPLLPIKASDCEAHNLFDTYVLDPKTSTPSPIFKKTENHPEADREHDGSILSGPA